MFSDYFETLRRSKTKCVKINGKSGCCITKRKKSVSKSWFQNTKKVEQDSSKYYVLKLFELTIRLKKKKKYPKVFTKEKKKKRGETAHL